ncbi:hypothetical protein KIN20_000865 [Parelaphostrongylus tenuis]|uniref:7TM GPCR serpentine receptor class x (Srx) domain-containing protein n=1 Tax=Parelaphostrongylus tenuis TaxID=148309 RepID=A0AAD5LT75_PARTN|nr:hypothetical protein KIN20_000865 [Parelaphostrongylus tenuis]
MHMAFTISHGGVSAASFQTTLVPLYQTRSENAQSSGLIGKLIGMVILISCFFHVIPHLWTKSCFFIYDPKKWHWMFSDTTCGHIIDVILSYTTRAVLVFIASLDFTTLICMRVKHKNFDGMSADVAQRMRHKREMRFVKQTVYQNALFLCQTVVISYISVHVEGKWNIFVTNTYVSEICFALDGFIIVLLHFRFSLIGMKAIDAKSAKGTCHHFPKAN